MQRRQLGIAWDTSGWWSKFGQFAKELEIDYEVFEIERSDWMEQTERFENVLWRPNLDPPFCEEAREKIYFVQHMLKKRVFPNWATYWHYDNKRAQAYLFAHGSVPCPDTFVSYSREEAKDYIKRAAFPMVSKNAGGASSEAVWLLRHPKQAMREVRQVFHESLTLKVLRRLGVQLRLGARSLKSYVVWQEYIGQNPRDLRVTIIGKKYAFVFWRNNRPGDFRASGSGLIDYNVADGRPEIGYCMELCRQHDFDSMAFDIVYRDRKPLILEISYAFNDKAIHDAPGHFVADRRGELTYVAGHVWPQKLVVRYVYDCMRATQVDGRSVRDADRFG